jgi:putative transposase
MFLLKIFMLKLSYKFRLYPNKTHLQKLEFTLELSRELYNSALLHRIQAWQKARHSVTYTEQANSLVEVKQVRPEFKEVYSQVLQDVLRRLDKNFKAYLRRLKDKEKPGFPRFKGKGWFKSLTYPQSGWQFLSDRKLQISKIGIIRVNLHRNFPKNARLKTLTLKKEVDKWYAIVSFEIPDRKEKVVVKNAVGIDVGITHFATLSDGTQIENPKYLAKSEAKLRDAQRVLSKRKKGTRAREKARRKVAKIHRKIANQRTDFLHKVSRKLVDTYDLIAFEGLKIKNMMQNGNLAKSIGDSSWGKFLQYITYKAERAGKYAIWVDPRGTSQICSNCGARVPKLLSMRVHICKECHIVLDRDLNASRNILRLGTSLLGARHQEKPLA